MKRVLVFFLLLCLLFAFLIYPILITSIFKILLRSELSRRFKGQEIEVKVETTPFFIFSSQFDKVEGKISPTPYASTNFEFIKFTLEGVKVSVSSLLRGKAVASSITWKRLVLSGSSTGEQVNSFLDGKGFPLQIEIDNGKILATPLGVKLPWLFGEKEKIVLFDPKKKEKSLENLLKLASEGFIADLDMVVVNRLEASAGRIDWELEIKAHDYFGLQVFAEGF